MARPSKHRPASRTEDTTFDRIYTYMSLEEEQAEGFLTPHEEAVLERYISISALSARGYPTEVLVKKHQKKHAVSRATAFRDLKNALEVFGDAAQVSRQAKRYAVEQLAKRGLRLAEQEGDARAHAQQVRNLILIDRLDQEDSGAVDPRQIQPPTLVIQVALPEGKAAAFDINKLKNIKDISYEDVLESYANGQGSEEQMGRYLDELEEERQ